MDYYYEVIAFGQIDEVLTYKSQEKIVIGSIVEISLRKKRSTGVVLFQKSRHEIKFDVKKILQIKSIYPHSVNKETIEFYQYLSMHYFIDLGMVYKMGIQHFPSVELKDFYIFSKKIFNSQKSLIDGCNISLKKWKELVLSKKIVTTTKSFLFDGMKMKISLNQEQKKNISKYLAKRKN